MTAELVVNVTGAPAFVLSPYPWIVFALFVSSKKYASSSKSEGTLVMLTVAIQKSHPPTLDCATITRGPR